MLMMIPVDDDMLNKNTKIRQKLKNDLIVKKEAMQNIKNGNPTIKYSQFNTVKDNNDNNNNINDNTLNSDLFI